MKTRKTIAVESIKNRINSMLLNSSDSDRYARDTMISFIENVLMETGNYKGFRYLIEEDMEKSEYGIIPGRHFPTDVELTIDQQFANTDCTRVQYF
jgi:hypothetical protein